MTDAQIACRRAVGIRTEELTARAKLRNMNFRTAAEIVLKTARRPLTAREIVERAVERGLLHPVGKTPEATMSAALYTAPASGPIRREFEPGPTRARRGTVRWTYIEADDAQGAHRELRHDELNCASP
jgi:hypothetical protein